MSGETRVSLVVGLLFIILFGLILSEITGNSGRDSSPQGARGNGTASAGRNGLVPAAAQGPQTSPLPPPRTPVVREPAPVLPPSLPLPPSSPAAESARREAARVETARVEPARTESAAADGAAKTHVVRSGETLSRIAAAYYGQANAARGVKMILEANRDRVESAARLRINTELTIPPMK